MAKNKQPKATARPRATKTPRVDPKQLAAQHRNDTPLFCFCYVDLASKFSWAWRFGDGEREIVMRFLEEQGRRTWSEIDADREQSRQKHHWQEVTHPGVEKDALADLIRMKLDEKFGDTMFRFRLGSRRRLWGFRLGRAFHLVWWDHDHKVYPTEPKNT